MEPVTKQKTKQQKLIHQLKDLRRHTKKNKAILSFKYDNLNFKINIVQISVIIISTVITFIETLKTHYELENKFWNIIPIILATYIGLIMAILRFLKLEERKEELSKCRENHVFIINKFIKTLDSVENFDITTETLDTWNNLVSNYETEIFDNYISIRANFDTIMKFTDVIYYKQKYKNLYFEEKFVNKDINIITEFKNVPNNEYKSTSNCCCFSTTKIKHNKFFTETQDGTLNKYLKPTQTLEINNNSSKKSPINTITESSIV